MKTSIQVRNGVSSQMVDLVVRLVDLIPWPIRRSAMGDVTVSLLDGKPRVAEEVFGWNRVTVELGKNEFRTKILCINSISTRRRPKVEEKEPRLLADIIEIMKWFAALVFIIFGVLGIYGASPKDFWTPPVAIGSLLLLLLLICGVVLVNMKRRCKVQQEKENKNA